MPMVTRGMMFMINYGSGNASESFGTACGYGNELGICWIVESASDLGYGSRSGAGSGPASGSGDGSDLGISWGSASGSGF